LPPIAQSSATHTHPKNHSQMPKSKGKGGKNRRRGKNDNEEKRELEFKDDGQEYAQVLRMLGNGRCDVQCFDGVKRLAHIRGKMRKKVWVQISDIVLVGLRDFQDAKCDIILKYNADEARNLKAYGELPDTAKLGAAAGVDGGEDEDEEVPFDFDDI
jgi:translation initiation factor 1A